MPPRFAYWTIIVEGKPTAFRAAERDDLVPTFKQLQGKHPDAVMMWFARGRLWASPDEARAAEQRGGERRKPDWRPGGEHKDPRARFDIPRDEKRRRFAERMRRDFRDGRREPGEEQTARPPRDDRGTRPPRSDRADRPPRQDQPRGDRPWRPKNPEWKPKPPGGRGPTFGDRPRGPRDDRDARPPRDDRASRPPRQDQQRGDRPWRPNKPEWKPKPPGARGPKFGDGPRGPREDRGARPPRDDRSPRPPRDDRGTRPPRDDRRDRPPREDQNRGDRPWRPKNPEWKPKPPGDRGPKKFGAGGPARPSGFKPKGPGGAGGRGPGSRGPSGGGLRGRGPGGGKPPGGKGPGGRGGGSR